MLLDELYLLIPQQSYSSSPFFCYCANHVRAHAARNLETCVMIFFLCFTLNTGPHPPPIVIENFSLYILADAGILFSHRRISWFHPWGHVLISFLIALSILDSYYSLLSCFFFFLNDSLWYLYNPIPTVSLSERLTYSILHSAQILLWYEFSISYHTKSIISFF